MIHPADNELLNIIWCTRVLQLHLDGGHSVGHHCLPVKKKNKNDNIHKVKLNKTDKTNEH